MSARRYAILGTPGYIAAPGRFDDDALLGELGQNSGNLMFQHAASHIVDAPLVHVPLSAVRDPAIHPVTGVDALIFPAANHLRPGADWTLLNGYLERADAPLVVLGLGAQSPRIGGEVATIAALKADPHVRRMAAILRERAVFVSIRGSFSQDACDALGVGRVHVLGCPSALINPDRQLGRRIAAQLRALSERPVPPRLAVTAAAPFEIRLDREKLALEQRLVSWLVETDGLYVQQSGGPDAMRATIGRWRDVAAGVATSIARIMAPGMDPAALGALLSRNGRFYLSAPDWQAEMGRRDVCLGTRLHGNMAAIAAGTPGIIIAHDSRTGELAETMHLPRLTIEQVLAAPDLRGLLGQVAFDGAAFDAWRARTAGAMTAAFDRLAIPVKPYLRQIARIGA